MPETIINSQIIEDAIQIDGRRHITERHTTDTGKVLDVSYLSETDTDADKKMADRIAILEQQLADEKSQEDEAATREVVVGKRDAYLKTLDDLTVKTLMGLNNTELAVFKELNS